MSKRRPAPVVMTVAQIAPGVRAYLWSCQHATSPAARQRGAIKSEVGAFALFLARSTMDASHVAA